MPEMAKVAQDPYRRELVEPGHLIEFSYTNHQGKIDLRKTVVRGFTFGATEYHPERQMLLEGFDLDRLEHRTYAVKDIHEITILTKL